MVSIHVDHSTLNRWVIRYAPLLEYRARQVKYLNNGIESDHAPIKKLTVATDGFKLRKRAWSTLQGFESLRMINKGQFDLV